ncbi:hypothetical protein LTR56_018835 [Elasticomyces elasticus]|nr:hypothetical protein LTR22_026996 [Elasticomyces elasticus]KAK3628098.1 hypothetical protein LTR56_018835 [Elasticomyces elasticus]KAK5735043.1 hypothetical protein LTS12_026567 [Elasticomyces elasticus]
MASISYYVFQTQISNVSNRLDWPTIRRNTLSSPLDHATRASWAALHARVVTNRYLADHLNSSSLRSTTNIYVLSCLKATANGTLSFLKATWTIIEPILTFTCKMLFEIMQLGQDRERARTDLKLHFSRFPKVRAHHGGSVDVVAEPTESEVSGLASTYSLQRREREKKEEREWDEKAEREREANHELGYKMMLFELETDYRYFQRNFEIFCNREGSTWSETLASPFRHEDHVQGKDRSRPLAFSRPRILGVSESLEKADRTSLAISILNPRVTWLLQN